jgi:transcriptional regulator with XRE-family HTH domain
LHGVGETLSQRLGRCVRELRLERGMTQIQLCAEAGLFQTYLSNIERGVANPSLKVIESVAGALGVSVFELFDHVRSGRAPTAKGDGRRRPGRVRVDRRRRRGT